MEQNRGTDTSEPFSNSIQSAEYLFHRTSASLNYAVLLSLYSIIGLIVISISSSLLKDPILFLYMIAVFLVILVVLSFFGYLNFMAQRDAINEWRSSYVRFTADMKYGLIPIEGDNREDRTTSLIFGLFDRAKEHCKKHPECLTHNVTTESGFKFDSLLLTPPTMLFVKYSETAGQVDGKELETIRNEAQQNQKMPIFARVIVLSKTGYTDDALVYAKKQDFPRSKISFDLIVEHENRYQPAYIGKRRTG